MSMFEKKLARFREAQERKRRKPMSKQHRTQMVKRLKEAMEKTKDPEMLLKLSQQAEKLMPKPGQETRGRKPKPVDAQNSNLLDMQTGNSSIDSLPDGARLAHHLVLQMESKCRSRGRGGWNALTRAEKDALLAETTATLSAEERAALETLNAEEVA